MKKLPRPNHKYGYTKDQIKEICKSEKIKEKDFWKAFGINTCPVIDEKTNEVAYYPCDIERALYILGNKMGKNHLWD